MVTQALQGANIRAGGAILRALISRECGASCLFWLNDHGVLLNVIALLKKPSGGSCFVTPALLSLVPSLHSEHLSCIYCACAAELAVNTFATRDI